MSDYINKHVFNYKRFIFFSYMLYIIYIYIFFKLILIFKQRLRMSLDINPSTCSIRIYYHHLFFSFFLIYFVSFNMRSGLLRRIVFYNVTLWKYWKAVCTLYYTVTYYFVRYIFVFYNDQCKRVFYFYFFFSFTTQVLGVSSIYLIVVNVFEFVYIL